MMTDAPRPALDAATLARLRERYTAEPTRFCPDCGVEMRPCGPSVMCPVHRWRWSWFGPGDPDVLTLLTAYESAAAERDALAREAVRLRRAVVLALDGPSDGEIGMETTLGRLNRIERQLRAALAPQEGATDGR